MNNSTNNKMTGARPRLLPVLWREHGWTVALKRSVLNGHRRIAQSFRFGRLNPESEAFSALIRMTGIPTRLSGKWRPCNPRGKQSRSAPVRFASHLFAPVRGRSRFALKTTRTRLPRSFRSISAFLASVDRTLSKRANGSNVPHLVPHTSNLSPRLTVMFSYPSAFQSL
jgi:hypothetical protein